MHSVITFHNLKVNINNKSILDNISASIKQNARIGLVGNNGSGKTTLLKILSKQNEPTSSRVLADYKIAYVKQFEIKKINQKKQFMNIFKALMNGG
ncbi:MAG: ATP-binding cassette domain-containing protein [Candidatus Dojkabacteria bacterium]